MTIVYLIVGAGGKEVVDIAERLGVRRQDMKESFKAARKAGRVKKSRRDDEGTNYFTLGDGGDGDGNGDEE
jgi:DNA-binding MarR family transcriptional regulator